MFKKILVPLDGSGECKSVLPYIRDLAPRFGAETHILGIGVGSKKRKVNRLLENYINDVARDLCTDNVKASPVIQYGRPAEEILTYVVKNNIDLIVMATHGRGGITRWWMGSVAEKIICTALIPVLIVRSKYLGDTEANKKITIHNILIPLDGSDIGEAALRHAEALAVKTGASLNLVHVIPSPGGFDANKFNSEYNKLINSMHDSGENYFSRITEDLNKKRLSFTNKVITGDPANVIIDNINEEEGNLIAMSTHGRSGIARWVLGSVTDKVLHEATIPMWLVRSQKIIDTQHKE